MHHLEKFIVRTLTFKVIVLTGNSEYGHESSNHNYSNLWLDLIESSRNINFKTELDNTREISVQVFENLQSDYFKMEANIRNSSLFE